MGSRLPATGYQPPDPGSRATAVIVAAIVATVAFWAYTKTLLPGVDLGDTGGFQAAVLWPEVSARQAYPLYYDLAAPFVRAVSMANPARGLNLFSAIAGAAAVGLLTYLCALIAESLAAGIAAGLLLAFSYTFWSQAIIAEVYTFHLTLILVSCLALYAYAQRPSRLRLAIFFGVYALAFGNHLSMILLLVPFTVFLLHVSPNRRTLIAPATIGIAAVITTAGALQYWPNFASTSPVAGGPASLSDRFATFWFDTTKVDWRDSMVMGVRSDQLADRLGMWWFDARQQFGVLGLLLAVVGAVRLWAIARPWTTLVLLAYAINTLFAFTYNVGDTHVFYLPGHLFTAFLAGAALCSSGGSERTRPPLWIATLGRALTARSTRVVLVALVFLYSGWRAWDTWPAIDRHDDRRADALVTRLALGANPQSAVLVTDLNWQLENALLYYTRWQRRDVPWVRLPDVQLHFPLLVRDNEAISRDMILDAYSARDVVASFGPLFPLQRDPISASPDLIEEISGLSPGTPYVLCVLTPPREERLDPELLRAAAGMLTRGRIPTELRIGGSPASGTGARYQLIAGLTGEAPVVARAADAPFRMAFRLLDDPFTVRMESWLPSDTFRRAGFGHVIRGREHVLTLERGVSLVWFDRNARPSNPIYAASVYSPGHRYRLSSASPSLADLHTRPISGVNRP
jgi:transmembrane protein TMEM260 (protein O-mannosyltransferase)